MLANIYQNKSNNNMVQEKVQTAATGIAIWGSAFVSWLEALQPIVTVLVGLAALAWTVMQMYYKVKNERSKNANPR